MFKSQRHKQQQQHQSPTSSTGSTNSAERFDFSFSNFQALQVPKGWDKLFVSIISVETGKTIAKTNKEQIRNGTCKWKETLTESLWIQKDDSSKELEECLIKLVISMGSARSGILGEAVVNMARYKSSRASSKVSLPLKKCNYGTILQVQIHCGTPRTKLRYGESKHSNSQAEVLEEDLDDIGRKSNGTDGSLAMSLRSQSSQDLGSTSHPENLGSTETSNPSSNHIYVSKEGSVRRGNLSPPNTLSGDVYDQLSRLVTGRSQDNSADNIYPADDPFMSNPSSFNSRITHSGDDFQNYEEEYGQSSSVLIATSTMTNAGPSRDLLEVAEDTIEELRDEAKMWERNSQKLTIDLDILGEKFASQSRKLADVEMELSAACMERDSMKEEVEQLKLYLEESSARQANDKDSTFRLEGAIHIQKELENEIKFHKEANAFLALQLEKSRDSNIEFLSVLQELEDTIEKQKVEIEDLSKLQPRLNDLEDSIQGNLEENRILSLQLRHLQESEKTLLANVQSLEQALEVKNNELENDRSSYQKSLLDVAEEYKCKLSVTEEDTINLSAKIAEIEELQEKLKEIEMDCSELTNENLELLCKLKELEKLNEEDKLHDIVTSELLKQIEISFHHIKRHWHNIPFQVNDVCESHYLNLVSMKSTDKMASKVWVESFFNYFVELNKLLGARIIKCEEVLNTGDHEINMRDRTIAEANNQREYFNLKIQELESSNVELEANLADLRKEMTAKGYEMEMLEADLLSKEGHIELLTQRQLELETQISEIEKERDQLKDNMEIAIRECNITSKCLDDLQNDLMVLSSSVDSNVSANKILQRKSSELEAEKQELELHLCKVEEENVKLSEVLSDLDAQLRDVEAKRKSSQVELENCKVVATGLQDEIRRLRIDTETEKNLIQEKLQVTEDQLSEAQEECEYQKGAYKKLQESSESLLENCNTLQKLNGDLREQNLELHEKSKSVATGLQDEFCRLTLQMETEKAVLLEKLQDIESRLLETQEECEYQIISNQKSQASTANFSEKCNTLQKLNGEMKKQNMELHENYERLETRLRESQQNLSNSSKMIETLEEKLSSVLEKFSSKEKRLTSELNVLLQENKEQKEKLMLEESLLNQMYTEKTAEVENLQREVEHLINQISATNDERDRIASDSVNEVSNLHADRAKLECALEEISSRLKSTEDELDGIQAEYRTRIQDLMDELAASKQSYADHEKLLKSLGNHRSSKEKLKTQVNDLELKLTVSEYERQQLTEETANLKAQIQKLARSQDDILTFESRLKESKHEKENLEALLHSITLDNEKLKAENSSFAEKIANLQEAMSEFEDCKLKRVALEEKLLHMARDLTAKEALHEEDDELKYELNRMKRAIKQYKRKIQQLKDENDELLRRTQSLEENLKMMEAEQHDRSNSGLEKGDNEHGIHVGDLLDDGVDYMVKVQLLEDELAEALEANNRYKMQLQSIFSGGQHSHSAAPMKSLSGDDVVVKERYERTKSSLESELIDLRDRYFQMSLQYAEVEAQREHLVMKLKATKNGKKWF